MNKNILAIAIVASMATSVAVAASGYNPPSSSYSGVGGAVTANAVSTSSTSVGSRSTGPGYQSAGGYATNITSAGASLTPIPNGRALTAHTGSKGTTETYAVGSGNGVGGALAAQGGVANADANTKVFDKSCGCYTRAMGFGKADINSSSKQGSIAVSANRSDGLSHQWSGAGAYNDTTAYVTVNGQTRHQPVGARVTSTTGVHTIGETWAYGYGRAENAFGGSGGFAKQNGGGYAISGGFEKIRAPNVNQMGGELAASYADINGKSIAGGTGRHGDEAWSGAMAGNDSSAMIQARRTRDGVVQKIEVESTSYVGSDSTALRDGRSSSDATAAGLAIAAGGFNGGNYQSDIDVDIPNGNNGYGNGPSGNNGIGNGNFDGINPGTIHAHTWDNE